MNLAVPSALFPFAMASALAGVWSVSNSPPKVPPRSTDYVRQISDSAEARLPEKVVDAASRIPNLWKRLTAMSCYFRRADEVENGWSWTASEVRDFKQSEEYAHMLVEIELVKEEFKVRNPGYWLAVNIGARSLGVQIRKWNNVGSVYRASREFRDSCLAELNDSAYSDSIGSSDVDRFVAFLSRYEFHEDRVPTVACPGLSKHGQLRAFDFKVMRGRRLVAGARSSTIERVWDGQGWTEKLKDAVYGASRHFFGPLDPPYEPWHYTYLFRSEVPEPDTAAVRRPPPPEVMRPSDLPNQG